MKRTFRKIMSLLLAVTLVFGTVAFGFADVDWSEIDWHDFAIKVEAAETFTEGYYTYTVDENGNATITDFDDTVSGDIVIPSTVGGYTVTCIGNFAFYSCAGLTSITIPEGITDIGSYAFSSCKALVSIVIPDTVTNINSLAFSNCEKLESVTIPEGITKISDYAFENCKRLISVTIPGGVTNIGYSAFSGCESLTDIYYNGNVEGWCNIVYSNEEARLMAYANNLYVDGISADGELTIPDSITEIPDYAFVNCNNITSVVFHNSVTSIGYGSFAGCCGMTSVTIPDSVVSIGEYAFCACSNLTEATISDSITTINEGVFYNCIGLKSVMIGNSVSKIENYAFYDCHSLDSITIPDSVTSIGDCVFYDCEGLASVVIGKGVTEIGDYAFYDCYSLTSVAIPDSVKSIGDCAFFCCEGLTSVTIGKGVTNIGKSAFTAEYNKITDVYYTGDVAGWCKISYGSTRSIPILYQNLYIGGVKIEGDFVIPDNVTSIGDYAFVNCDNLTSVTIPDSVTSIGDYAFAICDGLTDVFISDSVISIGTGAFLECYNMTDVTIGKGVTSLAEGAFDYCISLTDVYYTGDVAGWCKIDHGDENTAHLGYVSNLYIDGIKVEGDFAIPDNVKSISNYAFAGCNSLTSITIPDSVEYIGKYAFYDCKHVESITVDSSNNFYSNDEYGVLFNKEKTELFQYPIGNGRNSYVVPDGVKKIEASVFYDCDSLEKVKIPVSVIFIDGCTFDDCDSFDALYYQGTFRQWSRINVINGYKIKNIWYECDSSRPYDNAGYCGGNLDYKLYPDGELEISGTGSMDNWDYDSEAPWISEKDNIKKITITGGVMSIGDRAFYNCDSVTSVYLPESLTSIGSDAFGCCSGITSIRIPENMKSIVEDAFWYCTGLESIYYPGSQEQWEGISDYDSTKIIFECDSERPYVRKGTCEENLSWIIYADGELVISGEGRIGIYDDYYYDYGGPWNTYGEKVKSITISDSVKSIEAEAFSGTACYKDESNWENGMLYIGNCLIKARKNATGQYKIKDGTRLIAAKAFDGIDNLYHVEIPDSVKSMSFSIFGTQGTPTDVYYTGDIADWCNIHFDGEIYAETDNFYIDDELIEGELVIPADVKNIGFGAFRGFDSITRVEFENGVTSIGDGAFFGCDNITDVSIPGSVENVGASSFDWCDKLENLTISEGVTSIGKCAFWSCDIGRVVIPESITKIGDSAFKFCDYNMTVYYPGTPEEWKNIDVGDDAFPWAYDLIFECYSEQPYYGKGTCGENLSWILSADGELVISGTGEMTNYSNFNYKDYSTAPWYDYTSEIKSVKIGNGVTRIGGYAFYNCHNITNLTIPDSVTDIGYAAFYECDELMSITIPDSVTSIGNSAFYYCNILADVYYEGTEEQWNNITIGSENTPLRNATFHYNAVEESTTVPIITKPAEPTTTKPVEIPTTVKPAEITSTTKPVTTKPVVTVPSTTKPVEIPVTTKPVTTKPAEEPSTTNPNIENTTDSVVTKPSTEPTEPVETPTAKPTTTKPVTTKPVEVPTTRPVVTKPATEPTKPVETEPSTTKLDVENTTKPVTTEPSTVPATQPSAEQKKLFEIRKPSQTEITYGDSIILHADFEGKIPEDTKVIWATDNANFTIVETTANGSSCVVTPNANGETVFIATLVDADGNAIASDTQTMTSKAGFFQKIIAFFKKIFGLTKIIPEMLK